ncbi:maltose/maltodextrin ABC transporter substrate-binding protein MalE [Saccharopolyspora hordei]|uniref:Arabinogalactan oligomer/maltooligosaccharide transport system substrate-binding protein n=2 Tax=Saccharopolyspora hordei TaxID=1838 RepID=A0A853ATB9_9PSEU|nr:arabinogalactan oligomer/maltooligosaccharide transport system substrate-binding protein [Saccharopolyspora hordei]
MRRKATVGAALGLVGALAAGCGGSSGDPGEVVFWDTSGPAESGVFQEVATDCARTGGYRVRVETVSFDQALNNYKTAAQGGQGPDVLRADVGWVAQLAQAGLIQDLTGTPLAADTADFLPAPLASTQHEGKTYAVPQVTDALALFYNKAQLAQAGVEPPKTWEELKQIAPQLGGDRALFLNNDEYYALPFLYSQGGDLLDVDSRTITVNSPEAVRGVQVAKDLLDAGAARTALDQPNSYTTMKAAFTSGDVAMVVDGPWAVPEYTQSGQFADPANLGIAPLPGKGTSPVGGHDYVIRQGSDATEASIKFVQCMSSTENQAKIAARLALLPTRQSAYDDPAVAQHPVVSAFRPLVADTHDRPWIPENAELLEPLQTAYADILAGRKETGAALDELARTYQTSVVPDYAQR